MKRVLIIGVSLFIVLISASATSAYWCSSSDLSGPHDYCTGAYDCGCNCNSGREQQGCTSGRRDWVVCYSLATCDGGWACYVNDSDDLPGYCYDLSASCTCEDPTPRCDDCTLPANCPATLTDNPGSLPAEISTIDITLENYLYCSHSTPCEGDPATKNCYEPTTNSNQPVMYPYIGGYTPSDLEFSTTDSALNAIPSYSAKITGRDTGSNVPFKFEYGFYEPNGESDLEAIYFWMKTQEISPGTPEYIDIDNNSGQSPKTYTNNSIGFMMHRENGVWVPYVPSLINSSDTSGDRWVRAISSNPLYDFAIPGANGGPIAYVNVSDLQYGMFGNTWFDFDLFFTATGLTQSIDEGLYHFYVFGNDVFSFTPYDNYPDTVTAIGNYWNPEQIRIPRGWQHASWQWEFDFGNPTVNSFTSDSISGGLELDWNATDSEGSISRVVLNVYDDGNIGDILVNGVSHSTPNLSVRSTTPSGHLTDSDLAFSAVNPGNSGTITITGLDSASSGNIYFDITVFDEAGNYDTQSLSYDLTDWIFTHGDAVYSSQGTTYSSHALSDENAWSGTQLSSLNPTMIDLSSELFGVSNGSASVLGNTGLTGSYFVNNYEVYEEEDIYDVMLKAFNNRLPGLNGYDDITSNSSTLSGSLSSEGCTGSKCYARVSGNVVVNSGFTCDRSAIIFVGGNLTINPNLNTGNANKDACMFVVNGSTTINSGAATADMYHVVDAHIISNGDITVQGSGNKGLIVKGGLISDDGTVSISRHMDVGDRSTFPSLALIAHPKYGYLAKDALGTPISLVKYDVGFKGN